MLVDVASDDKFQKYLDREEQRLCVPMQSAKTATSRIHINTNGLKAEAHLMKRGGDLLLNHLPRRFHRSTQRRQRDRTKAAGVDLFLAEQLAYLSRWAAKKISGIAENLRGEISGLLLEGVKAGKFARNHAQNFKARA